MGDTAWKEWERTVAKGFSSWLTGGTRNDVLMRMPLQGRMVERTFGDLCVNSRVPERWKPAGLWFLQKFLVDAKNRKRFRLPGLLTGPDHEFYGWWRKLTGDAADNGKWRLMVLLDKPSNVHTIVVGQKEWKLFDDKFGWLKGDVGNRRIEFPVLKMHQPKLDETLRFCQFEKLLKWLDPAALGAPIPSKEVVSGA